MGGVSPQDNSGADPEPVWLDEALRDLPQIEPAHALCEAVLRDFDAAAAHRRNSFAARTRRALEGLRDVVWPGVPAWQPVAVLLAALIAGAAAGTLLPLDDAMANGTDQGATITLDAPPSFDLGGDSAT